MVAGPDVLAEIEECRRRTLADYIRVGVPVLADVGARAAAAGLRSLAGLHPLGWGVQQATVVGALKALLMWRDIGVWRTLFSVSELLVTLLALSGDTVLRAVYFGIHSVLRPSHQPFL